MPQYILLTGPSTVGKTTYAKAHYPGVPLIDSDDVWFALAKKHNWDRHRIAKDLFPTMRQMARQHERAVLTHTDAADVLRHFPRADVEVLLLVTSLRKLSARLTHRNCAQQTERNDTRPLSGVLRGYTDFLEVAPLSATDGTLYVRRADAEALPVRTKADQRALDQFIRAVFIGNRRSTRLQPRQGVACDKFIQV